VRQRTAERNSLVAWRARHAVRASQSHSIEDVSQLGLNAFVRLEAEVLFKAIARQEVLIKQIEQAVLAVIKPFAGYERLQSIQGIGPILAMTVYLETGDVSRFASSAHYASYCRTVRSRRTSNNKVKGSNNARNGNPHLAWAFSEAAHFAIRYDERVKRWFDRKQKRSNKPIAFKSLASELSKAAWHVMQGEQYESERLFG
jgi:transposase